MPMRVAIWGCIFCWLVALVVGGNVHAADVSLDEPGTYLIEASSGRLIHLGHGAMVDWAPDSKTVAVADNPVEAPMPRLRLIPVPDGETREVILGERGEINHLRWSPDGAMLAFTLTRMGRDPGPALMVADPATGTVRQLVRGSVGEIAWTPDSRGITAITLEEGGGSIVTFDALSGEIRETVPDAKDPSCQRGLAWSPDGSMLAYGGPGLHEPCGDVGNWGVWIWHPASHTTRQLFQGAADVPRWLADGDLAAIVSEPRADAVPPLSIVLLAPQGGEPRQIVNDVPRMFPQPPRLLQVVGNTILYPVSTCDVGEAYVWSPGRAERLRQTPEDVYAYRPSLAPDGRALVYVRVGEPNQLVLAPLGPGDPRVVASSSAGLQVGTAGPWDVGGDWSPDGRWIAVEVTGEQFKDCAA